MKAREQTVLWGRVTDYLSTRYALIPAVLSPAQRAAAVDWYPSEGRELGALADELGVDREAVIRAAAALSPATSWAAVKARLARFIVDARAGERAPSFPAYGRNRALAARIIRGDAVELTGPKVGPFARNLMGDLWPVTVDRHVVRMALGRPDRISPTMGERQVIQQAFAWTANRVNLRPAELQSLLWVASVGHGGRYGPKS